MAIATLGSIVLLLAAATALIVLPLPPLAPSHRDHEPAHRQRPLSWLLAPLADVAGRIRGEYDAPSGRSNGERMFWNNLQLLRIISTYAIVFIHMAPVIGAIHANSATIDVLRFGTDMFLVVAGFLTAHVVGAAGKPGSVYLRQRMIRLAPIYVIFTVLSFMVQNGLMEHNDHTVAELAMSVAFIAYGPFPVLYPTWTLLVIVELSVVVAVFQVISLRNGIYYASAFIVLLALAGRWLDPVEPALKFYTNPILVDFALGIMAYKIVRSAAVSRLPRTPMLWTAGLTVAACLMLVIMRPYAWPDAPRLLSLGVPVSCLVLATVILERVGVYGEFRMVNFLANCSYSVYVLHWFVVILAHYLVRASDGSGIIAVVMLLTVPIIITYLAVFVHLYLETPMTRFLSSRQPRHAPLPRG